MPNTPQGRTPEAPRDPRFPADGPPRRVMEAVAELAAWGAERRVPRSALAVQTGLAPAVLLTA